MWDEAREIVKNYDLSLENWQEFYNIFRLRENYSSILTQNMKSGEIEQVTSRRDCITGKKEDSKEALVYETRKRKQVTKRRYCNICGKNGIRGSCHRLDL